jgi:outer membrane lipoprotein-sorting protein
MASGAPAQPDINEVVHRLDELYRSASSFSEITMEIVTPRWQRTLEMQVWTRGLKKTFIRITSPKKEQGVTTLRVGSEMWNYLPNVNKVIKIPPSMMMGSWMGSDFTNDDLVKESSMLDDYTYRYVTPENPEEGLLYIEFVPKEDKPIVWSRIVEAVRAADYLPVWARYYDERGAVVRVLRFTEIRRFGGRTLPSVMEMLPQNKPGNRTVIRYRRLDLDVEVRDDVFSQRNLRSRE